MSNHSANGEMDDYLEGLLHDAGIEIPAPPAIADIAAAQVLADADVALAESPVQIAAAPQAAATVLSAEAIAADFLAEMDADPAFATAAPSPFMSTADLMAEMDADPAFGLAAPAAPAPARAAPTPMQAPHRAPPAPAYPQGLQALLAPGQAERINSERRVSERSTRWLRLRCGEQTYALELLKVQEVVLPVPLLPLRGTASAMLGIMNLRGQVVPVIDLGVHLGSSPVDMDLQTRVVVLEENGETMGLRVSAVEDVTSLTDQQIEPPDNARLCRISNNLFRGVARLGHQPMILLDASHLLH